MPFLSDLRAMLLAVVAALCLVLAIVQTVRLDGFLWIDGANDKIEKLTRDNNELRAELKSISDKKNEQAETTKGNIDKAEKGEREAKPIVEKIRNAPIGPNCETPGLEILRNEI